MKLPITLTPKQATVIRALFLNGTELTQSDVTVAALLIPSETDDTLKTLIDQGLVQARTTNGDKPKTCLYQLTSKGISAATPIQKLKGTPVVGSRYRIPGFLPSFFERLVRKEPEYIEIVSDETQQPVQAS